MKWEFIKKNRVSILSRSIILLFQSFTFLCVWFLYYNDFVFHKHKLLGGFLSVVVFTIVYYKMCILYRAFKVETYPVLEIISSQIFSFGIADLVLYVECCLIAKRYILIWPGILTAAIQIVGVILWSIFVKQYYISRVKPMSTLLIYGAKGVESFFNKISTKFNLLFDVKESISSLEHYEEIINAIDRHDVILLYEITYGTRTDIMTYCVNKKKTFYVTPRISDIIMEGFENRHIVDTPLLKYAYHQNDIFYSFIKRFLDILISLAGLVITTPIMLLTAVAIKLEDGGDIFFRQRRYTKEWREFSILKFRSMVMDAEKERVPIPCRVGDARITRVGNIIRRCRIDELPQLINILRGDMSLVGPRPERVEHVHDYVSELPEFSYRMRVKGGLTGYAQIYGKYNTNAYDKLKLDLMYIEHQSLLMDFKILLLTLKTVFQAESTEGFEEQIERNNMGKEIQWNILEEKIV